MEKVSYQNPQKIYLLLKVSFIDSSPFIKILYVPVIFCWSKMLCIKSPSENSLDKVFRLHLPKSKLFHLHRKYPEELYNENNLSVLVRKRMIAAKGKNTLRSLVLSSLMIQKYLTKAVKKPAHTYTR